MKSDFKYYFLISNNNFINRRRMLKYVGSRLIVKVLYFSQNEDKWKGGD
jgi:hypothetical protein